MPTPQSAFAACKTRTRALSFCAALLLAFAPALNPAPAAAQTTDLKVGNLSNLDNRTGVSFGADGAGINTAIAQKFTTGGPTSFRYHVRSVAWNYRGHSGDPGDMVVRIHEVDPNNPGLPGAQVGGDFTGNRRPRDRANNSHTSSAPAGLVLNGGTTYFVVWDPADANSQQQYELQPTDINRLDAGSADGWSIAREHSIYQPGANTANVNTGFAIEMEVNVTSASAPFLVIPTVTHFFHPRSVDNAGDTFAIGPIIHGGATVLSAFWDWNHGDYDPKTIAADCPDRQVARPLPLGNNWPEVNHVTFETRFEGETRCSITVTDSSGMQAVARVDVTVPPPPTRPILVPSTFLSFEFEVGTDIGTVELQSAVGGVRPYNFSLEPQNQPGIARPLPAGLSFDGSTNPPTLSGTPTQPLFRNHPNPLNLPQNVGRIIGYDYFVDVRDAAGGSRSRAVSILIWPANTAPSFDAGASATLSVAENNRSVGTLAVTEPDADQTLRFSLSGPDAGDFAINDAGELSFRGNPNFEGGRTQYRLSATVSDNHPRENLSDTIALTVNVTDVDTEAPDAPAAPAFSAGTPPRTALNINWQAPNNAGPAITGYRVEWRATGAANWQDAGFGGATPARVEITGLTAGTRYEARVRATNAEGTGEWSAIGAGSTAPPTPQATAPVAPAAPRVQPGTPQHSSLNVNWSAPADGGAAITGYDLEWTVESSTFGQPDNAGWNNAGVMQNGIETEAVISGLRSAGIYFVRVRALNIVGAGAWSSAATRGTLQGPAGNSEPSAPAAPMLANGNPPHTAINASWAAPADGGDAITVYEVQWRFGRSAWGSAGVSVNTAARSATISGLNSGAPYDVRVRARNGVGPSRWSAAAAHTTAAAPQPGTQPAQTVPGAPSASPNLAAGSPAHTSLNVSWNVPGGDGGSAITGYEVQWHDGGSASNWSAAGVTTNGVNTNATISGLTPDTAYSVRVRAVNAVGPGAWSLSGSARTAQPPAQGNTAPVAQGTLAGVTLTAGFSPAHSASVDVSAAFSDADSGDTLSFGAISGAPNVAVARASGNNIIITAAGEGGAQITVTARDGRGGSATQTIAVTVAAPLNRAPTADAGADQTLLEGAQVMLRGAGTDADGDALTYSWAQVSGPTVQLAGADTATATFTAPEISATEVLEFRLTVQDGGGRSGTDNARVALAPVTALLADVRRDGNLDEHDAAVMYAVFANNAALDNEAQRRRLLSGPVGSGSDADLRGALLGARLWLQSGALGGGGDINGNGAVDESDALIMYYAFTLRNLVGDGGANSGTAHWRAVLLGMLVQPRSGETVDAAARRALSAVQDLNNAFGAR